jgi:predicted RNA-binding protein (virulence factor B family)
MKLFYYQNNYCRLEGGSLESLTPGEAEAFCLTHRDTTLVGFIPPSEARSLPAFWSHSDLRVKVVRLDETFRSTIMPMLSRELDGIRDLIFNWLLAADQSLISFTSQIPIV